VGKRQSVQVIVLAGAAAGLGAGDAAGAPPVQAAAASPATSNAPHRRRTDVTFAPYPAA
jgi:hypothetical protein